MENEYINIQSVVYIKYKEIDKKKWDDCISSADNGVVYANSFYLDCFAKQWDAIVINDYEFIMPLPYRKKYGFYYLFKPDITPILGLFGNNISDFLTEKALKAIPQKFKLWDISLNHFNKLRTDIYSSFTRNNFILHLDHSYSYLKHNYNHNCQRNINKAEENGCICKKKIPVDDIIDLSKRQFRASTKFDEKNFIQLKNVYSHFSKIGKAETYGVFIENKLLASCAFIFFKNRAYYWLVGNDVEAKKFSASFLLVNTFIKDHCNKNIILDFEGSQIKGVADFYKSFGSVNEPYTIIYNNKLPKIFKLFKTNPY